MNCPSPSSYLCNVVQRYSALPISKTGEDRFGPPYLERSGSEHREGAVTSLAFLERARAWEWVKAPPAGASVPYKGNRKGLKDY